MGLDAGRGGCQPDLDGLVVEDQLTCGAPPPRSMEGIGTGCHATVCRRWSRSKRGPRRPVNNMAKTLEKQHASRKSAYAAAVRRVHDRRGLCRRAARQIPCQAVSAGAADAAVPDRPQGRGANQRPARRRSTSALAERRRSPPAAGARRGAGPSPSSARTASSCRDCRSRGCRSAGAAITAAIIHEDERLLVINKPAGIAVHGGSGISNGVIEALRAARPDEREHWNWCTASIATPAACLLVARKPRRAAHAACRAARRRAFDKRYLALVRGSWQLGKKRIDAPLRTDLRVGGERTVRVQRRTARSRSANSAPVQFFGNLATLMEVRSLTGRTHQIRVHAAYAGHPVAGDDKYGDPRIQRRRCSELGPGAHVPACLQRVVHLARSRHRVQRQRAVARRPRRRDRRAGGGRLVPPASRRRRSPPAESAPAGRDERPQPSADPDQRQADERRSGRGCRRCSSG